MYVLIFTRINISSDAIIKARLHGTNRKKIIKWYKKVSVTTSSKLKNKKV